MTKEEISQRMHEQNHRSTQYPLFVIQVDQLTPSSLYEDWDEKQRIDDLDEDQLCNNCLRLYENDEDLPQDCNNCGDECFDYYKKQTVFDLTPGVFFTEKACLDHIKVNSYHYNNPICYVIGAWRNEEMQTIMQDILKCTNDQIPNHYQ
jgi:hypothetical protein